MYSSTSRGAPTSVQSCLFADDEDSTNDAGGKKVMDADISDLNHEVYMCIVWHGGFLGLAYYDLGGLQIHFMLDVQENDTFSLVRQVVNQIHPSVIALNSIQDSRLLSFLRTTVSEMSMSRSGSSNDLCRLEFLPNVDFNYQVSKRRILALELPSVPKTMSGDERYLYFSSLLPFGNSNMISSVGGLLKYLEKTRVGIELEADVAHVPVLGFTAFIPENQIQIDGQTYCALKIFETEIHPSTYKSSHSNNSVKEGLSLYGILNRCKSPIGSRMLRDWFLRPLRNAVPLKQRHEGVAFFMSSQNMEAVQCLSGCLKHIKYIPKILLRMSKAQATIGDWVALYKTLYHAVYIGDIAKTQPGNIEIFRKIKTAFTEDLHKCVNLISKTIDFEESKIKKRFVVLPHIDNNLDEKKRMFNGLPDLMSEVARQEIEGLSSDIKECVVSYLPEIGYLLVIEKPEGTSADVDHTMEGLQFMFASNDQLFYKSAKTLELDDILGDTQLEIIDIELKTMHRLQTTILENTSVMLSIMDLAAQLDCLMSLAICAKEFGYVQPELIQENVISVKAGRHPLQELCCNMFVPNDIKMGGRNSKIKMITGPNACGKSVYLKQVALIVYMAHIGSFVPAEAATIGPCDGIFSRLKSTESVSNRMSTFMQDLSQVSQSLRSASASSLVILDEFGKGTESTDGLSLLTAVTKYWIQRQPDCPFLLVSTHFHSILQQRLLPSTPMVQYLTFDTLANEEELVFLYQLIPGYASSSYACKCAGQVGLPPQLVRRGQQVSDLLCQYKTVPPEDSPQSVTQRHRHERIVDKFLDLNLGLDDVGNFLKEGVLKLCEDTTNTVGNETLAKDGNGAKGTANQSKKESHNNQITHNKRIIHRDNQITHNDQIIHSNQITHKDKANASGSNEENFQPQRVAKSDLVRFESQENENTKSLAKRNDFTTPLLCPAGDASHTLPQSKKLFRIESDSDQISQEKAVKGTCHNTPQPRYDCTNSKSLTEQNVLPKNGGRGLNTDKLTRENSSVRDNSIKPLKPVEKRNPLFDYLSNKRNETLRKSNFPVQQSHPPFATPSSSSLVRNEVYSKSLGLVAGTKRKMESLHQITNTKIKHEMLFNPPTPCLGVSTNGSKTAASGPLTKPVSSSSCTTRHDSTTTTPTDTEDAKARKRSREIFRSLPCNQPDLLAIKFNIKNQALASRQFGNGKYPQDTQSQVKMCSPVSSGFPKGLRSTSASSGIEAKSSSRGESSDTRSSGVTSPKGEIKREYNSPDDYSSTS